MKDTTQLFILTAMTLTKNFNILDMGLLSTRVSITVGVEILYHSAQDQWKIVTMGNGIRVEFTQIRTQVGSATLFMHLISAVIQNYFRAIMWL